ncbi:MAG TPA: hypothetical protein VHM00_17635 [Caldimonas sp.]|nr:hypothetical protein [Caldimonas sp.]HEX2542889.1 hypothetical protein [Caldimonas sp.]
MTMAGGLLEALGLPKSTALPNAKGAPPPAGTMPSPVSVGSGGAPVLSPDEYTPRAPRVNPFMDPNVLGKVLEETRQKDKKAAELALVKVNKALADVEAYIARMPGEEISRSGYAQIMGDVRKRFPEAAGLSQWVQDTAIKVPEMKGKLPSPRALMTVVEKAVMARGAQHGWAASTSKNPMTVNTDRLLAAYMSELPAGVTVKIEGGVVKLSLAGAALAVQTPAGDVDATAGKGGTSVALKNDNFHIQVENDGWKEFDPQLRGEWKKISDGASIVLKLKAERDKLKLDIEQKKKSGEQITAELAADYEKREAVFNAAWKKLQEKITITAKASEEKIAASVAYLKKDKNDKDAVKAGVEAEVDLKELQGKLKAYFANPTLEGALQVTAAGDKVTAKLELTAVKTGVVVTASFEKALDETKAAIEVMLREGKTKVAAELKQKADDLSAKLKVVHQTKDLKLAAELEKTLKDVRGKIELEYKNGNTTLKGGASGSTSGEVGGTVQIDIALKAGRSFVNEGDKLSFAANVSTSGYKFEVSFSMGEPVETASLQDLFTSADRQIQELYKLAGDKGVRSIEDAAALNKKLQEVMAPVKDSAKKAKTLKTKSEISAKFGFSIQGDWPAAGKASAPAAMFGVTIAF